MPADQIYATYDWKGNRGIDRFHYCPVCGAQLEQERIVSKTRPRCPRCGYVIYRSPFPTVSVLAIGENRVLLGKRAAEPGKGKWALPSGYVEFEQDFVSAAMQEVKEETGLDIEIRSILNVQSAFLPPDDHFLSIYLLAQVIGGDIHPGDDLDEVGWFSFSEPLPEMAFPPDVDLIQNYLHGDRDGIRVQQREIYNR